MGAGEWRGCQNPVVSGQRRRGRLSRPADLAKTDETISGAEARTGSSKSALQPSTTSRTSGSPLALLERDGRPAGRTTSGRQSLKSSINEARVFFVFT